ncbi:MAG: hypothetical protein ACRC8S_03215 [Fimbriiglobus sp.]
MPTFSRPSIATVVTWLIWLASTLILLVIIDRYTGKSPYFDDVAYFGMNLLPKNVVASDFWIPLNEHRVPLPKFTSWAIMRTFGYNPRLVMRVDVLLVASGVAALLLAARSARGGSSSIQDAIFPLVLLSPGQAENFIWAVQVNFLLPAALFSVCAALIAGCQERISMQRALALGSVTVCLSLCGIQGQIPAFLISLWLIFWGFKSPGWPRRFAIGLSFIAIGIVTICLSVYERPSNVPPPEWDMRAVRYIIRVLGSAWGPVTEVLGPAEPNPIPAVTGLSVILICLNAAVLIVRAGFSRAQQPRATGLAVLIVSTGLICVGVGFGRGALNHWMLAERYITLAAPLVTLCYLAAVCFPWGQFTAIYTCALAVIATALCWPNAELGLRTAAERRTLQRAVESDSRRGVPASFFVDHHGSAIFPPNPAELATVFEALKTMQIAPYNAIPAEPKLREIPVDWKLQAVPTPDVAGWIDIPRLDKARIVISLQAPKNMRGIRVVYSTAGVSTPLASEMWWAEGDNASTPQKIRSFFELGNSQSKRAWIGQPIGEFHFLLEGPSRVKIERLTLLVQDE